MILTLTFRLKDGLTHHEVNQLAVETAQQLYDEHSPFIEEVQYNVSKVEYLTSEQLTEPGYYWWLPEYLKHEPEKDENWSVVPWHPDAPGRQKSGLFVGPLTSPATK